MKCFEYEPFSQILQSDHYIKKSLIDLDPQSWNKWQLKYSIVKAPRHFVNLHLQTITEYRYNRLQITDIKGMLAFSSGQAPGCLVNFQFGQSAVLSTCGFVTLSPS